MGIQVRHTQTGEKRYKARVKFHGVEVATRTFKRRRDAELWHDEQVRKLRVGEWFDPRRGQVPLADLAADWKVSRETLKRNTQIADNVAWEQHIEPRFGKVPVGAITTADVRTWVGGLVAKGCKPASAARYLAAFRSLLEYARHDGRVSTNVAAQVKPPTAGGVRREALFLTVAEVDRLVDACAGPYAELVRVLAFSGLRWGELAGLKVGDRVIVPGHGLRIQRAVLARSDSGELFEDGLKNHRARTVPLVDAVAPIVERWAEGKDAGEWLFHAPRGGPLSESNWKRSVGWAKAVEKIGKPGLRVHDLRHTCASIWLGAQADPKVVQRILGHASAAMTMDLYGHLIDQNLWDAAKRVGGLSGASESEDDPNGESPAGEDGL